MNLKLLPINRPTLLIGVAVIVLTNVIALSGVAYNRSGEPESRLTLTERELSLPYEYGFAAENSGFALRLDWRVFDRGTDQRDADIWSSRWSGSWSRPDWIDKDKLTLLGFDVSYPLDENDSQQHYDKQRSREVYLVLEYDGVAYKQALKNAQDYLREQQELLIANSNNPEFVRSVENAKVYLRQEEISASRLFVIDAGLDSTALRTLYADNIRYLITRGEIEMSLKGGATEAHKLGGRIKQISVDRINVPVQYRKLIESLTTGNRVRNDDVAPRYQVNVNYGQRFEPWVVGIAEYQTGSDSP